MVDILFKHIDAFTVQEFNWIVSHVKQHLEALNLADYFLDDYVQHSQSPAFSLSSIDVTHLAETSYVTDGTWLLQRLSNTELSATYISARDELKQVESEMTSSGILQANDSLVFITPSNFLTLEKLDIQVNKTQLDKGTRNQLIYLVIKTTMLAILVALVLISLRLINRDQQRKLDYLALKEDFLSLVSHELKTPLAGIRAMAETLEKRSERSLSIQPYPARIVNEADKLWYMVDNILGFNRVQSNEIVIQKRPANIKALCDAVSSNVRSFSKKTYAIRNRINESETTLLDIELFSLVIKNIIINAGLYNNNDTVEIDISYNQTENAILISDNGIGVSQSDRDKIFKPFVRLQHSTRQSGTGLGLAICKRIMRLHDGDLSLLDSNSNGSVWKVGLAPQQ